MASPHLPGLAHQPVRGATPPAPATSLDPDRTVDPNLHGNLLTTLHKATIESENHGRNFLKALAENRRLALLPQIAGQFERLRA